MSITEVTNSKDRSGTASLKKRLLVLGGGGITGRLIVEKLLCEHIDITIASRNILKQTLNGPMAKVKKLTVDICNEEDAIRKLSGFDLVMIAVGPFKTFGNLPHKLCIKAGVDCIDINDEVEATIDIYKLNEAAKVRGVRVFTGMGLNPGLMTYMLLSVLNRSADGYKDAFLRLFVGGKQDAGYAAVHVMLEGFTQEVAVIRDEKFAFVSAHDKGPARYCKFPGMRQPVKVMHCSTSQTYSLTRNGPYNGLRSLDFRIHFQGVAPWMVTLLRKWTWIKKEGPRKKIADMIYKSQDKMKHRKGSVASSIAFVQCSSAKGNVMAYCTGLTSYEMTARFAAVMTELLLAEKTTEKQGVSSMEDNIVDWDILSHALQEKNILINYFTS